MTRICRRFDNLGLQDGVPDGRRWRLGIMGGTFDPIHVGHLACAEQVRVAFDLDAVIFIPTGRPAFKQDRDVTPAEDRLRMCELACLENLHFDVSSLEIRRHGITYTVDTLRELREHYPPNVDLYFITGADAMHSIVQWRESAAVAQLAHLVAVTRPGYPLTEEKKREIAERTEFDVSYFEMTALSISSSMLREWVEQGRSIRYLVPNRVHSYIETAGLYRKPQEA